MGQKKTPALVSAAKKLRAAGRSNREIADNLTRRGVSVSEATVRNWLGPAEETAQTPPPGDAAVTPVAPDAHHDAEPIPELTPEQQVALLTEQIVLQQRLVKKLRANNQDGDAQRESRLGALYFGLLQKLRARQDDEGDSVRVEREEIRAAADRAIQGLRTLTERVVAERATWPTCTACGQPCGEFPPADKSPLRAMVEQVFGRAIG